MVAPILIGLMSMLLVVTSHPVVAQGLITFETIPGEGTPRDGMEISTQYRDTAGVTFRLDGGGFPQIAQVGAPTTAFAGPPNNSTPDQPAPGQNVGRFFLTDNGRPQGADTPPLIIQYDPPTAAASGVIIDIDLEESFRIEARGANGEVIEELLRPGGSPGTGDGIATSWSFERPSNDIHSIRFVGFRTIGNNGVGLAFDNFSARSATPGPTKAPIASTTASDHQEPNLPAHTLDEDLNTRWSALGDGQWIRYELASAQTVNRVDIAWYQGDQRTADFSIESSLDGVNWTEVFRGTSSGTTIGLQSYRFAAVTASFIRIVGFGNSQNAWNSLTEVCVFVPGRLDGERVDVIGSVPGNFTTDGGDFVLTVSPRDADGILITEGVTEESFQFVNVRATRADNPSLAIPATTAEVTDVLIENAKDGESVTLVLDFDSSGSMASNDRNRLRVTAGKRILQFLGPDDRVAIMDFGVGRTAGLQASRLLQDFTSDIALLEAAIDRVVASGGTPLYNSILDALTLLANDAGSTPAVVVLTDGEDNGNSATPDDVVNRSTALNQIPVCTVGLGNGVGIPPLQAIARETGCTFAQATDAFALDRVFEQITRSLLEGRVIVSGIGRFETPLQVGSYIISGILRTTLDEVMADTPFQFPVEISQVNRSITRTMKQPPVVPYTAEEEAAGYFSVFDMAYGVTLPDRLCGTKRRLEAVEGLIGQGEQT